MNGHPISLSVIMAVRDGELYLREALESIRTQTWTDFELIVVDDGSTDGTGELLAAAARDDHRLRVFRQAQKGLAVSLNHAIDVARGVLLARHDADDRSSPDRFAKQIAHLRANATVLGVGTAAVAIDANGATVRALSNRVGPDQVRNGLQTLASTPVHGSMMLRRGAVVAAGGYRPAFHTAQDLDLWLRLSERGDLDNLSEPLYEWRLHQSATTTAQRAKQLMYAGIASLFAYERDVHGLDSYSELERSGGDLLRFAKGYRERGRLEALWGELLFRGLNDPRAARTHFGRALAAGYVRPRTCALYAWSRLGRRWPGGPTLHTLMVQP